MNEETTWEIRGEELHYGADAPLVRDPIRSLGVDLDGMRLRQSYSRHDGKVYPRTSLDGEGILENATLGIAGEADSATSMLSVALVRTSGYWERISRRVRLGSDTYYLNGPPEQAGLGNGVDIVGAIRQLTKVLKFGCAAIVVMLVILALR